MSSSSRCCHIILVRHLEFPSYTPADLVCIEYFIFLIPLDISGGWRCKACKGEICPLGLNAVDSAYVNTYAWRCVAVCIQPI